MLFTCLINLGVVTDYSTGTPQQVAFDNAVGAHLVRKGYGDWSSVPTAAVGARFSVWTHLQ